MVDWKGNKGSGPWAFTEQLNKWGYLNNPRWSNRQDSINFCAGLGLETSLLSEHKPCGHWHKTKYFPITGGKWVAAMQQPGTPYIYVYDIETRTVIRINTSVIPVIVDGIVELNSAYALDYDMGYGNPGAQRGAYCMNKDGTRIWYLFCDQGLYPVLRGHPDAELVEVDITSYYMRVVKRTTFPGLLPAEIFPNTQAGRVNDGCSDDTHTYWCTQLVAGRIIKIRNSDHVIVDDHYFNYPIEPCSAHIFDEAITTIDAHKPTEKLFWIYNRDHTHCVPSYNGCGHFIRSDTDLVQEIDSVNCGLGVHTWAFQNMVRFYNNYILHHRAYHPSLIGWLGKYNLDYSYNVGDFVIQEYLQNILGVRDEKVFTLMLVNSVNHPAFLYCLNFNGMNEISKLDVSYYAGQRYPDPYGWDWTSVSAMNQQTGVIAIFRYNNYERRNYAGCFSASPGLGFLCDARFERIYDDPTLGPFGEPQSWPLEGFTAPPVPPTNPPVQTTDPNPGPGEIPYVPPPPPPDDIPDGGVVLVGSEFIDHTISIGPGQTLFFKFVASVPDCDHPIQVINTPGEVPGSLTGRCVEYFPDGHPQHCATCGPCPDGEGQCINNRQCLSGYCNLGNFTCQQPPTTHLLVKRGNRPTISEFNQTWSIAPSIYDCGLGQWIPAKDASVENLFWNYNMGYYQAESIQIKEPRASDTYYVMLYNNGTRSVRNQKLTISYTI